jgi:hypothetical protein
LRTRIEKKIHDALANEATTLDQIAALYAQATGASFNIYRRVDFPAIDAAIVKARGEAGLTYVTTEARRKQ